MKCVLVGVTLLWLWPQQSYASILISEVAWMGSAESANDEWIELYNGGEEEVFLDGWVLTDGDNLEIELAGAVGAGQYAVLERTNDDSAPGPAFLLYKGALKNSGATLSLIKADQTVVHEVVGGENWREIGGSNITKETAQFSDGVWVTGVRTPGEENIKVSEVTPVTYSDKPFVFATSTIKTNVVDDYQNNLQAASLIDTEVPNVAWPYLALFGLLLFSTGSVYLTRNE